MYQIGIITGKDQDDRKALHQLRLLLTWFQFEPVHPGYLQTQQQLPSGLNIELQVRTQENPFQWEVQIFIIDQEGPRSDLINEQLQDIQELMQAINSCVSADFSWDEPIDHAHILDRTALGTLAYQTLRDTLILQREAWIIALRHCLMPQGQLIGLTEVRSIGDPYIRVVPKKSEIAEPLLSFDRIALEVIGPLYCMTIDAADEQLVHKTIEIAKALAQEPSDPPANAGEKDVSALMPS